MLLLKLIIVSHRSELIDKIIHVQLGVDKETTLPSMVLNLPVAHVVLVLVDLESVRIHRCVRGHDKISIVDEKLQAGHVVYVVKAGSVECRCTVDTSCLLI